MIILQKSNFSKSDKRVKIIARNENFYLHVLANVSKGNFNVEKKDTESIIASYTKFPLKKRKGLGIIQSAVKKDIR